MAGESTSRTKARLAVVAIFLLGVGAGGLGMNLYLRQTGITAGDVQRRRRSPLDVMKERLGLTPDQAQQVGAILDETKKQYDDIKEDNRPRFDAVREKQRERIRAVLTTEQLPKYEELMREWHEKMQRRGGPNGRHGGPGGPGGWEKNEGVRPGDGGKPEKQENK